MQKMAQHIVKHRFFDGFIISLIVLNGAILGLETSPTVVAAYGYVLAWGHNIILAVFNLIPIPPLDGSRMVYAKLKSREAIEMYRNFSRYGMFILIGFLFLGGFERVIMPLVALFFSLLGLPFYG